MWAGETSDASGEATSSGAGVTVAERQGTPGLSWRASVRLLGLFGGRAHQLDLDTCLDLHILGVRSRRRRAALSRQISALLGEMVAHLADPVPPHHLEISALLRRLVGGTWWDEPEAASHVRALALAAADPELLAEVGSWMGERGADLQQVAAADEGAPQLALVDIEVSGTGIAELTVLRARGERTQARASFIGRPDPVLLAAWLDGAVVVAHNGDEFDFPVLARAGVQLGQRRLDTLKIAWIAYPGADGHSLADTVALTGGTIDVERHTADADVTLLWRALLGLRAALRELSGSSRTGVHAALEGHLDPVVLEWILGERPDTGPTAAPMEWRVAPPPVAASGERWVETADLDDWKPAGDTIVATTDLRRMEGRVRGRWASGARVIDGDALLDQLAGSGWSGAIAWRICEAHAGMLAFWPPSAVRYIHDVPTRPEAALEVGDGPYLTDPESLLSTEPTRPVVLHDAVELLLAGEHERLDPATVRVPVTAVVAHPGPIRRAEMIDFWTLLLGGRPRFTGTTPARDVPLVVLEGIPPAARPEVTSSRSAAIAAQRAMSQSVVLVTHHDRAQRIARLLARPWRELTGRSLLRPPSWPTVREAERRLREHPHLAVATVQTARRLVDRTTAVVVDRLGGPSPRNPVAERMLRSAEDPFGAVFEPGALLRVLALVAARPTGLWVCDPAIDSPLLRAALAESPVTREPVAAHEIGDTAQLVSSTLLGGDRTSAASAREHLDAAVERLLGPDGKLKKEQETVILPLLDDQDVLAVFRTGFGKSICYQAPALALADAGLGATLVVSPLVALQRDQVRGLRERSIWEAVALNGQMSPLTRAAVLRGIAAGFYRLIYVAPEALGSAGLRAAVSRSGLALVAIDEAHCITEMGHDFRPDYRTIPAALRRMLGAPEHAPLSSIGTRPRLVALTGTASPATREDIVRQLEVGFRVVVDSEFVRRELRFAVRRVPSDESAPGPDGRRLEIRRWELLLETLRACRRPGIVYVQTRGEADLLADLLAEALPDWSVAGYHAGMDPEARSAVEAAFLRGDVDLIVATNAFGMGIDKGDIHTVVHWKMPGSPEALYQEAGRAARAPDEQADCIVLYHPSDLDGAARIRQQGIPTRTELVHLWGTLEELHQLQGSSGRVIASLDDLRTLAGLRRTVDVGVALAHLARVGLLTIGERQPEVLRGGRTAVAAPDDLPELETTILGLLPATSGPISVADLVEQTSAHGHATTLTEVRAALRHLERVGCVRLQPPSVAVRRLATDPEEAVRHGWSDARAVARHLAEETWCSPTPSVVGIPADRIARAVEVLAVLGAVDVAAQVAPEATPRVKRRKGGFERLTAIADSAPAVVRAALRRPDGICAVGDLAAELEQPEQVVRDALVSAHIFLAVSLDPRSWEDRGQRWDAACRVVTLNTAEDPDAAIAAAASRARERAHADELRRRALRAYAELPVDPDADPGRLAYQRLLEMYFTEPSFLDDLQAAEAMDLRADLDSEQRIAVDAEHDRLVVLAGAGTGKTRTLTRRIAYRVSTGRAMPSEVLAVCFARDAAGEMTARLAAMGVTGANVKTLHSFGWSVLRDYWPVLDRPPLVELEDQPVTRLRRVCQELGLVLKEASQVGEIAQEIARCKARMEEPDSLEPGARAGLDAATFARVYAAYERDLSDSGHIDYADQIRLASQVLDAPGVLDRVCGPITEVYVDEAQDLSPAQWRLIRQIAPGRRLTVVGDPRQAIFEWNGASPERFDALAAEAWTFTVHLVRNYRSRAGLLTRPNQLMSDYPELVAALSGDAEDEMVVVDQPGQADAAIITAVRRWLGAGVPDDEIAVLHRRNDGVDRLLTLLREHGLSARPLGVRALARTAAFTAVRDLVNTEVERALEEGFEALMARLVERPEVIARLEQAANARVASDETPWDEWARLTARMVELEGLHGVLDPVEALTRIERDDDGRTESGIVVTTVSRAKGLEWDAVVIADADAKSFGSREEDRRHLYVALTRARSRRLITTAAGLSPLLRSPSGGGARG